MQYNEWNLEIKLPEFFRAPGSVCLVRRAGLFAELLFFYNNVIFDII
jgi:hypothetical protein